MFTADHPACTYPPEQFISPPEANEATETPANTTKSFSPCIRPRSAGVWLADSIAVAPMKPKFHPTPSRISARTKAIMPAVVAPGETTVQFTVPVIGDTAVEQDEAFYVIASNVAAANLVDPQIAQDAEDPGVETCIGVETCRCRQCPLAGRLDQIIGQFA